MEIDVKVFGSRALFEYARNELEGRERDTVRLLRAQAISAVVTHDVRAPGPADLVSCASRPTVILVEVGEPDVLDRIGMLRKESERARSACVQSPLVPALLIGVCDLARLAQSSRPLPDWMADVMFAHGAEGELAQRILLAIRKNGIRTFALQCGALTLLPDSRSVMCDDAMVRLSPTEFALAELFLGRLGSVVDIGEVRKVFDLAGKSVQANNIRVAIFQFRMKIEEITGAQLQLVTVYRKGYCLRQSAARPLAPLLPTRLAAPQRPSLPQRLDAALQ